MKYLNLLVEQQVRPVAPCAGAGIEIGKDESLKQFWIVAPCAGAGIEIHYQHNSGERVICRPLRGGGD